MTKQEYAIKYITENYLDYRRLRHDIVADKLQIRMADSLVRYDISTKRKITAV